MPVPSASQGQGSPNRAGACSPGIRPCTVPPGPFGPRSLPCGGGTGSRTATQGGTFRYSQEPCTHWSPECSQSILGEVTDSTVPQGASSFHRAPLLFRGPASCPGPPQSLLRSLCSALHSLSRFFAGDPGLLGPASRTQGCLENCPHFLVLPCCSAPWLGRQGQGRGLRLRWVRLWEAREASPTGPAAAPSTQAPRGRTGTSTKSGESECLAIRRRHLSPLLSPRFWSQGWALVPPKSRSQSALVAEQPASTLGPCPDGWKQRGGFEALC